MRDRWTDHRLFWREFRRTFRSTGAVMPSGRALAAALTRHVQNGSSGRRILEVGPGTGAVTAAIVAAMQADDRLTLVECNEQFVERLRERLAEDPLYQPAADRVTLLHADVLDLPEDEPFDLIISGLPLNNFSVDLVDRILQKLSRLLTAGGTLSFFEYVGIRRAKSLVGSRTERERLRGIESVLRAVLDDRSESNCVLANLPPAWAHHVKKVVSC